MPGLRTLRGIKYLAFVCLIGGGVDLALFYVGRLNARAPEWGFLAAGTSLVLIGICILMMLKYLRTLEARVTKLERSIPSMKPEGETAI